MKNKIHIKKGDNVVVISGKDKGKKGKVLSVGINKKTVLVEGINIFYLWNQVNLFLN